MKPIARNAEGEYESNDLWYSRLPLISHYYFGRIKKILCSWIEDRSGVALDFGCGQQRLKKHLPRGVGYIGYDIIPAYTDIDDYRRTSPDYFFSISSFEHVTHEELDEILRWINRTASIRQIFIDLPIDNDRYILWTLIGLRNQIMREHRLETVEYDLEDMHRRIGRHLTLTRSRRYHNHMLTEWRRKG